MVDGRGLSPEINDVIGRIREIAPLLASNSLQGEVDRRIPDESFDALVRAGAFRVSVPGRFGGFAANSRASLAIAREIGRGDGGASWVFGILNSGAWVLSLMQLQAQEDAWSAGPDQLISIVLTASSKAAKEDGGYRVTGKWAYGTGSRHSHWSLLGVPLEDADGNVVDSGLALIPASDLSIEETWYVAGMRSTGSNTQVANDVFVPDHRILPLTAAIEGKYPGSGVNPEVSYRPAFVPALALQLVGPHLGMGRAVLDMVSQKASSKGIAFTSYDRQADAVVTQLAIAKAALLLETAEIFADQIAGRLYESAEREGYPNYAERVRMRAHIGYAVDNVTQAIDILVSAHGSAAFADANPIQRFWRDQATAARHAHSLPSTGYEAYGKVLVGLEDAARSFLPVL
ncbi:acyl-CoA dehydrogenase family protein [Streptomyces sp. 6N223]|uniref:acyl-CoA dehydrogenase family protein n=1 Tax=Streptomyces sp. 6N223 TaxID=3457412 RepID=UPI003FD5A613